MSNAGPLEFVVILVILAIFVVPIVALVLYLSRVRPNAQAAPVATTAERDPAVELLRRRLANGEIDEVEYQRLRTALQGR